MTTFINASTSSGLVVTPDNSGAVAIQNNGVTGLNLDASGRLTTPLRPAFYVRKTVSQSVASGTTMIFDTPITNIGSCYSTATNSFTAPVAGVYSFTSKIWMNRNGLTYAVFAPCVNGSSLAGAGAYYDSAINNTGNANYAVTIQYYLNANDTFSFRVEGPTGSLIIDNSGYFCGFLVG